MGRRPTCSCTRRRNTAMSRCPSLESNWVSVKDVTPCTMVAPSTANTSGLSRSARCLPMTPSMRNLVDAGSTSPHTRLTTISTKPSASRPRRGRIRSFSSGRTLFRWSEVLPFGFEESLWLPRVRSPRAGNGVTMYRVQRAATGPEPRPARGRTALQNPRRGRRRCPLRNPPPPAVRARPGARRPAGKAPARACAASRRRRPPRCRNGAATRRLRAAARSPAPTLELTTASLWRACNSASRPSTAGSNAGAAAIRSRNNCRLAGNRAHSSFQSRGGSHRAARKRNISG